MSVGGSAGQGGSAGAEGEGWTWRPSGPHPQLAGAPLLGPLGLRCYVAGTSSRNRSYLDAGVKSS